MNVHASRTISQSEILNEKHPKFQEDALEINASNTFKTTFAMRRIAHRATPTQNVMQAHAQSKSFITA